MNKRYILYSKENNAFLKKNGSLTENKLDAIQFMPFSIGGSIFKAYWEKKYLETLHWVEHNRIGLSANFDINFRDLFKE